MSHHLDVKLIYETLPALIIALIADTMAGYVMNRGINVFQAIPGLLMVIPALIDMRGNVYGAFIARLSSKLHLGEIKDIHDERVKIWTHTAIVLANIAAVIVGIIAGIIAWSSTGNAVYIIFIPAIILTTHLFTTSILSPLTAYIGVKTHEKGWNPDNVGVPLLSSAGDLVSVVFIILVGYLLLYIFHIPALLFILFFSILTYVVLLWRKIFRTKEGRTVFLQSMPILLSVAFLELITGGMWEANKIAIILLLLPPILETLGNIGSVFSSRLSSFIYLGFIQPTFIPRGKYFLREILSIGALSAIMYSFVSIFVLIITWNIKAVFVVWLSVILSLLILLMLSYYLTIGSLKIKLDPDNVVVPVITTSADIIGTISIIFAYYLIF